MTYKMAPVREDLTLDETWSTLLRPRSTWLDIFAFWFGEEWNTSITKSQRSTAGIPCIERNNCSFCKLCETEGCFLHLQLTGTNVWLPKCTRLLLMLILSLPENQSPETILICIVVLCFPLKSIVGIHMCDDFERSKASEVKRAERLSPLVIFGLLTASPARSRCTQKRPPFYRCVHCWYSPRAFTRSHPLPVDTFSVPTITDGNARTVTVLPVLA